VATPAPLAVAVFDPLKAPLAPEDGGVKVTVTPESGFPPASLTVTTNGLVNAVPIVPL
jgi:hypothetical protein